MFRSMAYFGMGDSLSLVVVGLFIQRFLCAEQTLMTRGIAKSVPTGPEATGKL